MQNIKDRTLPCALEKPTTSMVFRAELPIVRHDDDVIFNAIARVLRTSKQDMMSSSQLRRTYGDRALHSAPQPGQPIPTLPSQPSQEQAKRKIAVPPLLSSTARGASSQPEEAWRRRRGVKDDGKLGLSGLSVGGRQVGLQLIIPACPTS